MADQDLNLKVITTADTTGLKQTSAELEKIRLEQERQNKGAAALFAKVPPKPPVEPPKPPVKPEEDEASKLGEHIGKGLERVGLHAIGAGLVLGAIEEIKRFAEEINKITEALDKQGEILVKNVQLMGQEARFAQTIADIIKVGETGVKGQAEQHKNVIELQKKELSWYEKIWDAIGKIGELKDEEGDAQKVLNTAVSEAAELEESARKATYHDVQAAKAREAQRAVQSYAETVKDLTARMKEQKAIADARWAKGDAQGYLDAQKAAEEYKNEIAEAAKLEKERQQFQKINSSAEDELKTKAQSTQEDLAKAEENLRMLGVAARTPAEAFEAGVRAGGALGEEIKKMAIEWAKLQQQVQKDVHGQVTGQMKFGMDQVRKAIEEKSAPIGSALDEDAPQELRDFAASFRKDQERAQRKMERVPGGGAEEGRFLDQLSKGGGVNEVVSAIQGLADLWK